MPPRYTENNLLGLPPKKGWPHKNEYVLYCDHEDKDIVMIFQCCYEATHFLESLIDEDEYEFIGDDILLTVSGVTVRSTNLREIEEHEFTPKEASYILPPFETEQAKYLVYGEKADVPPPIMSRRAPKISPSQRGQYLGIKPLAARLGITPPVCRGLLRKSKNIKKPDIGWLWKPDEIDEVVEALKDA